MKTNKITTHTKSLMLLLGQLYLNVQMFMENVGHLFYELAIYRGRPGMIEFNLDSDEYDGYVIHRTVKRVDLPSLGTPHLQPQHVQVTAFERMTFRISNRWLVRNGKLPVMTTLWKVGTEGMQHHGLNVVEVVWGRDVYKQLHIPLFDLRLLPTDEVLAKRNRRRLAIAAFLERWFPAPEVSFNSTIQNTGADIIKRIERA